MIKRIFFSFVVLLTMSVNAQITDTVKIMNVQTTHNIFKEIEKYDISVEMLEQQICKCGKWVIHIFEKESKIEVARYE